MEQNFWKNWRPKSGTLRPETIGYLNRLCSQMDMLTGWLFILLTLAFATLPILRMSHRCRMGMTELAFKFLSVILHLIFACK